MSEIHYFQRYHQKENVATANTMLLLKRLYTYSPINFYQFLEVLTNSDDNLQLEMHLQEKGKNSVPDAIIFQPGFEIRVETKLYDKFSENQLLSHCSEWKNPNASHKILLTVNPEFMNEAFKKDISLKLSSQNIKHINTTFEQILSILENDIQYENDNFREILEDYKSYCLHDKLLSNWQKLMDMRLCGETIAENIELNLYYNEESKGYSKCKYLGLYHKKAIRAIGEIIAHVVVSPKDDDLDFNVEDGKISEEIKDNIRAAINNAPIHGYNLLATPHRFFIVKQFVDTFFEKKTPYAPMGKRIFNLCDEKMLNLKELNLSVEEIAEELKNKSW